MIAHRDELTIGALTVSVRVRHIGGNRLRGTLTTMRGRRQIGSAWTRGTAAEVDDFITAAAEAAIDYALETP